MGLKVCVCVGGTNIRLPPPPPPPIKKVGTRKEVRADRPESLAGGGWFEVLWNLECPVGLSQREICAHFNEGNLAQFRRSAEK